MQYRTTEWAAWRNWVTPNSAKNMSIHRWYLFPHSFTSNLVHALIDEWGLDSHDRILDPFSGAGTTILAAKEVGVPCIGYDLSPLAVLVGNAKTTNYEIESLVSVWNKLERCLHHCNSHKIGRSYPDLVRKALPNRRLEALDSISTDIDSIECSPSERGFFRLALISIIPKFSHATANGGWLRWLYMGEQAEKVPVYFKQQVEMMLTDVVTSQSSCGRNWYAQKADVREMPAADGTFSALITSPPYPNRHDYTRIFGVELMFMFQDWEENKALRYQTFHSHPEARPNRPKAGEYNPPKDLEAPISLVSDNRIRIMLHGYFLDMYLGLREVARVCQKGAKVALVLGNARYDGQTVMVDEITAEIGEQAGLCCNEIRAVRWRGNSAQQMGQFGRTASRESVVIFEIS